MSEPATHDAAVTHRGNRRAMNAHHPYFRLLMMAVLSFLVMYALMYAMVDKFEDVYPNLNQAYMAGLMTAPMVVLELALMGAMYESKLLNGAIFACSVVAVGLFWLLIRQQTAIGDAQFLRSMIPHHSGAILMCGRAPTMDLRIRALCRSITAGQQSEIDLMRNVLNEIEGRPTP